MLAAWNARIHQFRDLLVNPDQAPQKAQTDLKCGEADAEEKLTAFMAEIMAPAHLALLGYQGFKLLIPTGKRIPDFEAQLKGKGARVEVKNLREPKDRVRTVAVSHWKTLVGRDPKRYSFRVLVRHRHQGPLSQAAQQRLRTILDILPDTRKNPINEVLDGGLKVRIEKIDESGPQRSPGETWMLRSLNPASAQGQMVVVGTVGAEDLALRIDEIQCLLLKVLPRVVDALPKFFGEDAFRPDCANVIALRWEPPTLWFSPEALAYTEEKIESLFAAFDLQLKPIIFCDPAIPWDLIERHR
jgi:hypothetical protein